MEARPISHQRATTNGYERSNDNPPTDKCKRAYRKKQAPKQIIILNITRLLSKRHVKRKKINQNNKTEMSQANKSPQQNR